MKLVAQFAGASLICALLALAYVLSGPHYRTTVLASDLSLETTQEQLFEFLVDRPERYLVEVELGKDQESDLARRIVGDMVWGKRGSLAIPWRLLSGGVVLDSGGEDPATYTPSAYGTTLIGNPSLNSGIPYELSIQLPKSEPGANEHQPIIHIHLHPAQLEYRITQVLGIMLWAAASAMLLLAVSVLRAIRRRRTRAAA